MQHINQNQPVFARRFWTKRLGHAVFGFNGHPVGFTIVIMRFWNVKITIKFGWIARKD
jgi:hypothetical protein